MLANYFAIQTAFKKNKRIEYQLRNIEDFFKNFTDRPGLVLCPRHNDDYLSFRYCGLEVLRLQISTGHLGVTIEKRNNSIRSRKTAFKEALSESFRQLLTECKCQLLEWISLGQVKNEDKKSLIPGFSPEHWLENLLISATECGKASRKHLGLPEIEKVATQVPVITVGKTRRKHRHIDIVGIAAENFVVVELKVGNAWCKAKSELNDYVKWALGYLENSDPSRGNPKAMIEEGYLPNYAFKLSEKTIRPVAVIRSNEPNLSGQAHGIQIKVLKLPDHWIKNVEKNISIFSE